MASGSSGRKFWPCQTLLLIEPLGTGLTALCVVLLCFLGCAWVSLFEETDFFRCALRCHCHSIAMTLSIFCLFETPGNSATAYPVFFGQFIADVFPFIARSILKKCKNDFMRKLTRFLFTR